MKHLLTILAGLLIMGACAYSPKAQETRQGPYTVTVIADNVYHIQDCNDANPSGEEFDAEGNKTHFNNCSDMYLCVGDQKALLIDLSNKIEWADNAGDSLRSIVYDRIGDKELVITFTHNHGDHTGMLPAFIHDPKAHFALPETDFRQMEELFPNGNSEFYGDAYVFDLGGMKINSLVVPGHTAGSVVFFLEEENIMFAGDAIGSGHGVWIFDLQAYRNYVDGFAGLVKYIEDSGMDKDALNIYGGHYWQKDWFPELGENVFGWQYILDMQQLIANIADGTAVTEPSNLNFGALDTYFRNGQAIITWNAGFAQQYRAEK